MPTIKILPHPEYCPNGAEVSAPAGTSICEALLDHHINIEHACEMSAACTTCHVVVRQGFNSLNADGDLLSEAERAAIDALMSALRGTLATATEAAVVEAATKALADGTEAFAAQRMNRGIQQALAGKNVEAL